MAKNILTIQQYIDDAILATKTNNYKNKDKKINARFLMFKQSSLKLYIWTSEKGVTIQWTGTLDWTTGLTYF